MISAFLSDGFDFINIFSIDISAQLSRLYQNSLFNSWIYENYANSKKPELFRKQIRKLNNQPGLDAFLPFKCIRCHYGQQTRRHAQHGRSKRHVRYGRCRKTKSLHNFAEEK